MSVVIITSVALCISHPRIIFIPEIVGAYRGLTRLIEPTCLSFSENKIIDLRATVTATTSLMRYKFFSVEIATICWIIGIITAKVSSFISVISICTCMITRNISADGQISLFIAFYFVLEFTVNVYDAFFNLKKERLILRAGDFDSFNFLRSIQKVDNRPDFFLASRHP